MNDSTRPTLRPLGSYVAKRCPLRVQLDLVEPGEPIGPTPDVQLRWDEGNAFEQEIVEVVRAAAAADWVFVDEDEPHEARTEATIAAIEAGAPVIVGAWLPNDEVGLRSGAPDLLVRDDAGYVPVDVKHHRTLNADDEGKAWPSSPLATPFFRSAEPSVGATLRKHKGDALQLAHYRRMLEAHGWASENRMGGIIGKERVVVWYDLEAKLWTTPAKSDGKKRKRRTSLAIYDFEFDFRRDMAHQAIGGDELLAPVRISDCDSCGWRERCSPLLEEGSGDPSLLPGVGYREWRLLREAGITDRAGVAALDYTTLEIGAVVDLPKLRQDAAGVSPDTPIGDLLSRSPAKVDSLRELGILTVGDVRRSVDPDTAQVAGPAWLTSAVINARAALGPEPVYRKPGVPVPEIERADIEIDVDMENVLDGVYLWGTLTSRQHRPNTPPQYEAFVTWDSLDTDVEFENFIRFWEWLEHQINTGEREGRSVIAYCWHESAENTQLKRIAKRDPELRGKVDDFIASGHWVDLKRRFKQGWTTGGSNSLKAIAPLAGFDWRVDDPGGGMSTVKYQAAASGDQEARQWLLDYNKGDVEATRAIRDWLLQLGSDCPRIPGIDGYKTAQISRSS